MSLLILFNVFTVSILGIVLATVLAVFSSNASPFQVPSLLRGYDNGLLYALNPCAFLDRCQQRYGPIYRVSLGYRRFIVVSTGEAIKAVLSASQGSLRNDVIHKEMFDIVAGVRSNFDQLHEVMVSKLFPLVDKTLSPRFLGQTARAFGPVLLSQIKEFIREQNGSVSLTSLTNEPLYAATNLVLLGSAFPSDTYKDFRTLSRSVPYRFGRLLLWRLPSFMARRRLLQALSKYLQRDVGDHDDEFSRVFLKAFQDHNIQSTEGAQLVLNFLWGVHSNVLSNSLFLVSFLLHDPDALARVRAEIDLAVERFSGLEALLEAGPDKLDDPSFELLTSAVMETLRLTVLHVGIRQADRDFNLGVGDGVIPIKRGEYVLGNVRAAHMDATVYQNPETFVVDRFVEKPYRRNRLQTNGYLFHSLGGGKHICKGRWLSIYQIKVLMIILLHMFDFGPTEEGSTDWPLLRVHHRSVGIVHTEDDIFVRLIVREGEEGQGRK